MKKTFKEKIVATGELLKFTVIIYVATCIIMALPTAGLLLLNRTVEATFMPVLLAIIVLILSVQELPAIWKN